MVDVAVENFFCTSNPTDCRLAGRPCSVASNCDMISFLKPKFFVKKARNHERSDTAGSGCAFGVSVTPAKGSSLAPVASWPGFAAPSDWPQTGAKSPVNTKTRYGFGSAGMSFTVHR